MRRDELESRQVDERASKARAYQKSRQDEFELTSISNYGPSIDVPS